jgi:hypothetical protein
MRPKVGEPRKLSGMLRFGWLKRLKTSARSCRLRRSPRAVFLTSEALTFSVPGPSRVLRPALPNVPGAGNAKADVSNQRSGVRFERVGSPTTFGRSFAPKPSVERPVPLLSMSESRATVNGLPVWSVTMPKVCQPLKIVESQPRSARCARPLPNGRS